MIVMQSLPIATSSVNVSWLSFRWSDEKAQAVSKRHPQEECHWLQLLGMWRKPFRRVPWATESVHVWDVRQHRACVGRGQQDRSMEISRRYHRYLTHDIIKCGSFSIEYHRAVIRTFCMFSENGHASKLNVTESASEIRCHMTLLQSFRWRLPSE